MVYLGRTAFAFYLIFNAMDVFGSDNKEKKNEINASGKVLA